MFYPRAFLINMLLASLLSVGVASAYIVERAIAKGVDLRILPLGDSITWGSKSTDGNGYRLDLLNKFSGNKATYIGSNHAGSMTNNANEGWPGYRIAQIAVKANNSLPARPNVVLLMAGINDIRADDDLSNAPKRLGSLLDQIYKQCPDATTIVAQLTPVSNSGDAAQAKTYNAAIPGLVSTRTKAGQKLVVVDMTNTNNGLTTADLADGLHPNNGGYVKMANVWFDGLNTASSKGLITAPVTPKRSVEDEEWQ